MVKQILGYALVMVTIVCTLGACEALPAANITASPAAVSAKETALTTSAAPASESAAMPSADSSVPDDVATRGDIGDNLSYQLLIGSRWFDTETGEYKDFMPEDFVENDPDWSAEKAPEWQIMYTFRETDETGAPTNVIGMFQGGAFLNNHYFEFDPDTRILSESVGNLTIARYTPAEDIGSVRASGMIGENPVYICAASGFGNTLDGVASVIKSDSDGNGGDTVWIYAPGGIQRVDIVAISHMASDDSWKSNGQLASASLKEDGIFEYVTQVPEADYPRAAVVCWSKNMKAQYAYAISWDGAGGSIYGLPIKIAGNE